LIKSGLIVGDHRRGIKGCRKSVYAAVHHLPIVPRG
jgi:hypothetical protein